MQIFSLGTQRLFGKSKELAASRKLNYIGVENLLYILVEDPAIFPNRELATKIKISLDETLGGHCKYETYGNIYYTPRFKKVMDIAGKIAQCEGREMIQPKDLYLGILNEGTSSACEILKSFEITLDSEAERFKNSNKSFGNELSEYIENLFKSYISGVHNKPELAQNEISSIWIIYGPPKTGKTTIGSCITSKIPINVKNEEELLLKVGKVTSGEKVAFECAGFVPAKWKFPGCKFIEIS